MHVHSDFNYNFSLASFVTPINFLIQTLLFHIIQFIRPTVHWFFLYSKDDFGIRLSETSLKEEDEVFCLLIETSTSGNIEGYDGRSPRQLPGSLS